MNGFAPNSQSDVQPNTLGYEGSFGFSAIFWAMVCLTGVGAGIAAGLLMVLLHAGQHWAWSYSSGTFLEGVSNGTAARRVGVLLMAGVLVGVYRAVRYQEKGGHSGQVPSAIWFEAGEMPFWHTMIKAAVSILAVAFGAAMGRESAPKQAGAAIGNVMAKWAKLTPPQRRFLVACGAGAGVGAVYNVPIGGALFALEVLLGQLSLPLVLPALATSLIAVATSWLLLPNEPTYSFPFYPFATSVLPGAAILGVLAGFVSVLFVKAIAWADACKPKGAWTLMAPILVLGTLGLASIAYPQLLGNGKNDVQLAFLDQMSLPLLTVLFLPRAIATVACLAAGTPSGVFTPTITVGALLGGIFGNLWNHFLPGEATAAYAIFGAGAVLAASTKGPVSALLLMFELTNHVLDIVIPLMLSVAIATLIARHYDIRSIYSARVHLGRAAAAEMKLPQVISAATRYGEVLKRLLPFAEKGLPVYVVDQNGALAGEICGERAARAESFAAPLETACAADLTTPTKADINKITNS